MAQLKDTTVSGSLRATDTIYSTKLQTGILYAPTTNGGTTYGSGIDGNLLLSNGSSIYWGSIDNILWKESSLNVANLYDFGFYINHGSATGPSGGNYYTILNVPYHKASGNTKPDWAWSIGSDTVDSDKFYFRKSNQDTWRDWRQFVHIAVNSEVGSVTTPVYITANG